MNIHIYSDILRERARGMSLHSTLLSLSRETLAALYSSTSSTYSRTAASAVLAILSDHDVALIAKLSLAQDDAGLICSEDGDLSMSMTRDDDDDHDDDDPDVVAEAGAAAGVPNLGVGGGTASTVVASPSGFALATSSKTRAGSFTPRSRLQRMRGKSSSTSMVSL